MARPDKLGRSQGRSDPGIPGIYWSLTLSTNHQGCLADPGATSLFQDAA
jgi:hypothetical protein